MTVELPPAPSRALSQLMKSGAYASPVEAVAEGLRLLQQLLAGTDQIRAGKVTPFDAAAARIKARGRKLLGASTPDAGKSAADFKARLDRISRKPIAGVSEVLQRTRR